MNELVVRSVVLSDLNILLGFEHASIEAERRSRVGRV
jgi:hypothetical protein